MLRFELVVSGRWSGVVTNNGMLKKRNQIIFEQFRFNAGGNDGRTVVCYRQ